MYRIVHPIFCVLLLFLHSCSFKSNTKQEISPIPVKILPITEQTQVNSHTYVGRIEECASIPISTPIGGLVTDIYVKSGEQVKIGQPLFRIDTTQAYNSLQIAQATWQQINDGYQRAQQVYHQGGVTEQKMVELRSQLQQAQSMLAIARKHLEDCTITAPRDGIIAENHLQVGQNIAPTTPVIILLDVQKYNVTFNVPEKDMSTIVIGCNGNMNIDALGISDISIRVTEKDLIANRLSHTYTITAELINTTPQLRQHLLPGMVGKIQLQTQVVEGIIIPATCIHTQAHSTMVWVIKENKAVRRTIEVGTYTANGILITSGLSIGDTIITSGYQKMYNGAPITY